MDFSICFGSPLNIAFYVLKMLQEVSEYAGMRDDKAKIFLLVDLREFFSDLGSGGRKKINKKALKMTSYWSFSELFFFFFFFFY